MLGVAEPRRHPRLAAEPLAMLFRRGELVAKDFDGDQAMQRDVARKKDDAHPAAAKLAHDLELGAKMLDDLLALPLRRHNRELAGGRQLEGVSVWIDEVRQGAHDCNRMTKGVKRRHIAAKDSLSFSDTASFRTVCLRKEHAHAGHYGSRLPKVTYRCFAELASASECPIMGRGARWWTTRSSSSRGAKPRSFRAKARSAESRNRRRPGRMALCRDGCDSSTRYARSE